MGKGEQRIYSHGSLRKRNERLQLLREDRAGGEAIKKGLDNTIYRKGGGAARSQCFRFYVYRKRTTKKGRRRVYRGNSLEIRESIWKMLGRES